MSSVRVPLRVTLDATPLLGPATGVHVFTNALMRELAADEQIDVSAFAMSGRNANAIGDVIPPRAAHNHLPMPAGVLTGIWKYVDFPPLDLWMQPGAIVHGTNFVVPPTRTAAQLVTVHDLTAVRFPELCTPASLRYPGLVERAVRRGAHVHTLSNAVANDVEELLGIAPERIHVIPPGVARHSNIELKAATSKAPYVFAIGTIEPRKDYPTLLAAFDLLADSLPDARLIIAGDRGWGAAAFDAALVRMKHRDRVQVLGRITEEQYDAYLRQAGVLAYPSLYEGFGYPPLEAMGVGVPVVTTDVASLPEVCGDAALFVPTRDPDQLAAALQSVLTDEHRRTEMIDNGFRRVEHFRWKNAGSKFVELYKELAP